LDLKKKHNIFLEDAFSMLNPVKFTVPDTSLTRYLYYFNI
jgi:hypothetical protein